MLNHVSHFIKLTVFLYFVKQIVISFVTFDISLTFLILIFIKNSIFCFYKFGVTCMYVYAAKIETH
jgi:hypothetical protein